MFSAAGLIVLAIAVLLPFMSPVVRDVPAVRNAVLAAVGIRQCTTLLHIAFGPLPTVNKDPMAFQGYAMGTGYFYLGGNEYAKFLRGTYDTLGGSHLLGCEIAQVGFSIGLVALINILVLLGYTSAAPRLVLLFTLMPSVLLNTSVVLREGLQVGAFLTLAYALLHLRLNGFGQSALLVPAASVILIWLHKGFAPYLLLFLPFAILWALGSRPWLLVAAVAGGLFLGAVSGPASLLERLQDRSDVLEEMVDGRGLTYIDQYQEKVGRGRIIRTAFSVTLDLSSPTRFLVTGPVVAAQYLFAPFPWQLRGIFDLYGAIEAIIRFALFCFGLSAILRASGEQRRRLIFVVAMFLSMELVWAAGTANWGTAFRHRVVAWGLLVALGGPALMGGRNASSERSNGGKQVSASRSSVRAHRRRLGQRTHLDTNGNGPHA